jgi:hypothetical protein
VQGTLPPFKGRVMRRYIALSAALAILPVFAQTADDKQKQSNKKQEQPAPQEPAPLFGGQIGTRSSQTKKESATLGFNGIDPSGKVEKKMLSASAGEKDVKQVRNMDASHPTHPELVAFLKQGGLKGR